MNKYIIKYSIIAMAVVFCITVFSAVGHYAYASSKEAGMNDQFKEHRKEWKKDREEKRDKIFDELGLSEDQRKQLKEYKASRREEGKEMHQQIKAKKEQLQEELQKSDFNEAQVRQIHQEIKALKDKVEDQRLESILRVRSVLTPEQYGKFKEMKGNYKDEHEGFKMKMKDKFREDRSDQE